MVHDSQVRGVVGLPVGDNTVFAPIRNNETHLECPHCGFRFEDEQSSSFGDVFLALCILCVLVFAGIGIAIACH